MKAVVWHGVGDIRLDEVPEPKIQDDTDAIVRLTASAICGTDLHMVRGTFTGMQPGTILGHEGVGIVEAVGKGVRNFRPGQRVVIGSTIGCGSCSYCRAGYFAQCDTANPNGKDAGTAFFGGPKTTGPFQGMQAEFVRVPYANVTLVALPDEVTDDEAILLSDIYPTAYFGADLANIHEGHTVAVFGCGPVGQFVIASAFMQGATRVIAIDTVEDRLEMARKQNAEVVNFNSEHPVAALRELTGGIGPDRVIDAVGVDAVHAHSGPAAAEAKALGKAFKQQVSEVAPKQHHDGDNWIPGDAPSQVLLWGVESIAKAGTMAIIGVYPPTMQNFPIGMAMNKNITLRMGNCNHRKYLPMLVDRVKTGMMKPTQVLTNREPVTGALEAYKAFDTRRPGWIKVELEPAA